MLVIAAFKRVSLCLFLSLFLSLCLSLSLSLCLSLSFLSFSLFLQAEGKVDRVTIGKVPESLPKLTGKNERSGTANGTVTRYTDRIMRKVQRAARIYARACCQGGERELRESACPAKPPTQADENTSRASRN